MRARILFDGSNSGVADGYEGAGDRRSWVDVCAAVLVAIVAISISVDPLRAQSDLTPEVGEILSTIREAPTWEWSREGGEHKPDAVDDVHRVVRAIRNRPRAALQALRIAMQDDDVLVRHATVSVASSLWRYGARLDAYRDLVVAALDDPEVVVRFGAASELDAMEENAVAISALIDALGHPDPAFRFTAALGLREVGEGSEPAMAALIEALEDPDPIVRRESATALVIGKEREPVIRALIGVLGDPDAEVRAAAVWSLHGSLERRRETDDIAISALAGALSDSDHTVRHRAIRMLGTFGQQAGPAAPGLIERMLDNQERLRVRMQAASVLGTVWEGAGPQQDAIIDALMKAIEDPEARLRNNAMHALGAVGPSAAAAVPALTEILASDPVLSNRGSAGHTLGRIGQASAAAVPLLAEAFWSEDVNTAWGATNGLIGIGPEAISAAMPTLAEVIVVGSDAQRHGAFRGIREFRSASAEVLAILGRLAEDPMASEIPRVNALVTMIAVAENASNSAALRADAFETMVRIAEDGTNPERLRAEALRPMADLHAIAGPAEPVLRQIYETEDGRIGSYARRALRAMGAL